MYSSRATRIEVWIYKTAAGAQETVKYVMTKDAVHRALARLKPYLEGRDARVRVVYLPPAPDG